MKVLSLSSPKAEPETELSGRSLFGGAGHTSRRRKASNPWIRHYRLTPQSPPTEGWGRGVHTLTPQALAEACWAGVADPQHPSAKGTSSQPLTGRNWPQTWKR